MAWSHIVAQSVAHSLEVLARPNVELVQETKPVSYFCCASTGRGPFREIGRIVVDDRRTRIFMNSGLSTSELAYLTTAFLHGEKSRWDARLRFIHKSKYVNSGRTYRVMKVCRPIGDDDLSIEAFESINRDVSAPADQKMEVTPNVTSAH